MRGLRITVQLFLFCVLSLVGNAASAATLTLSGSLHFPALDGSAQDADGLTNGIFSVAGDLVLEGTIHCNDASPLLPTASACPIRIAVTGDMTMEAGSGIFAENQRSLGNGGNIRLDVGGDLTLHEPDGSLAGAVVSTSRTTATPGNAGSLTAVVTGAVDLQVGSILAASTQSGSAGAISVTGEAVRVAGLVASGPSRTVLSTRLTGEALAGGIAGQSGGTIHLRALGSSEPGILIETDGIVASQGELLGGGRLVLLEACGIEVRGLIASLSKGNGPSQVVLRSGRGILVDGRDLGSADPVDGRRGRIRADGTQQGAAGYLVDLFSASDLQILGPDAGVTSLFAVTSNPGELPLRDGGSITAISLAGALTATGNVLDAGRDNVGNKGGFVDLQARADVTLDEATVRAVGGLTGKGGHIDVRSFQGNVSWTFGRGDVRPTGTLVLPSRRGTIEITACAAVDTTGSQFPVNGSAVAPFPAETEGVCSEDAPSLPADEPPLPTCVAPNQPPAPSGGPFSVLEDSANGTVVGTVAANDPNPGQSHTFSILSGNTGGAFAIDGAGVITVANSAALDFNTNPVFSLTVEVTDNGTPSLSGTANVTINVINNPEAPVATDEGTPANPYVETVGNTILEVTASPVLTGAKIVFNGNLLANDTDPDGPTAFIVTLESATPGAEVSLNSDGTFTYLPPPGFTGVDSFTYRITDPEGLFDTANVYINVEHRVWYVKNDATAGGLGRSTDPFDTLAEAESASSDGDTIYLFEGDATTGGQSDGITLKDGQRLIGEAVQLAAPATVNINGVDGPTLRPTTGSHPKIENDDTPDAAGEDNGVSVPATAGNMNGVEIRGLDIAGFDNAIDVTATGANNASVTIRDNVVSGANMEGLDVNAGSTGTVTLAIQHNELTATGNALDIQTTAGAAYITAFDGNVVGGNTGSTGINVIGVIFDLTPGGAFNTVSGGVTVIGAPGNGVGGSGLVLNNVQGDLSFADLDIFADGGAGLRVSGTGSGMALGVLPGVGIVEATGGPAVDVTAVALTLPLSSIQSTNSPTTGLALNNVTGSFSAGSGSSISNITSVSGTAFQVGGSNAIINYAGTISTTMGKGVDLTGNTGSTIDFTGALTMSSGANTAFNAVGGGTVTATDVASTLATTTGTALNVANTTIGSNGLKFRSISAGTAASGPASGVVLSNTGSTGGLSVLGSGAADSGGIIQNTASHGVSLTSTLNPSFSQMKIQNTAGSGIKGTQVTNFTFTNGTIDNSGTALGVGESNIAFNSSASTESNVSGTVTITGNSLINAYYHGVDILNFAGTLDDVNISNNVLTSSTSTANSKGTGVRLQALGSATTASLVMKAAISNNVIANFPSGAGILAQGGNSSSSGPSGAFGTPGSGTNVISITGNRIAGASPASRMGTSAIIGACDGKGQCNFDISSNGTVANPLTNIAGTAILCAGNGNTTSAFQVNGNFIVANNSVASNGIGGGTGVTFGTSDTPTMAWTITNNNVSATDGNGILAVARGATGTLNVKIQNNTVATPLSGVRQGIRVDAGNAASTNDRVCLNISGNTSAGSGGTQGIGLRKQGAASGTNAFGVEGMAATSSPGVEAFVDSLNPAGNGTLLISAVSGFTNCSLP